MAISITALSQMNMVIKSRLLHRIPDSVSDSEAALSEPLACCTHAALERVRVDPAETVLVTGPGAIGLLMLQVVRSTGARVILCGVHSDEKRLKLGGELGADRVVDIEREDLASIVMEGTRGYGVDKSFECAGVAAAAGQCIGLTRKGGTFVQMGLFGKSVELPFEEIALKELTVVGSFAQKKTFMEPGADIACRREGKDGSPRIGRVSSGSLAGSLFKKRTPGGDQISPLSYRIEGWRQIEWT